MYKIKQSTLNTKNNFKRSRKMKKIFIFMVVMLMTAINTNAQKAIEQQKFLDNTYVGVAIGGATDLTFDNVFPGNVTLGVRAGKLFNPVFGIELDSKVWLGSTNAQDNSGFKFDNPFGVHNTVRALDLGLNGIINLNNWIGGYKGEPRRFEFNVVSGLGWNHVFNPSDIQRDMNSFYVKTAVDVVWNLGKKKAHALFVQPGVHWNLYNHGNKEIEFNVNRSQFTVAVGYIYRFKTSNGTHHFKQYDITAFNDEINMLRAENEELKNRPEKVKEIHIEKIVEREIIKIIPRDYVICFAQNSAVLTEAAKTALNTVPVNSTVKINATASPEGSKTYNQKLSERRAEAVKNYLTERNVTVVEATGLGVESKESNRIAMVTIQ